ncbi:type II toxin-antitoxin system RelE/ParE family toxin [uncultured Anaerococcus sp.]|uniref:type II toxin-antitoxin system RelE/ParE family toxin n=1 Tax=uncultured Anaerococcus sp. TaxID=293428 RepID=UPI0025FC8D12|nr:type II toxin-antitoxin system RelE/ParE family toxin [uncultured Anaerococcus sp.]
MNYEVYIKKDAKVDIVGIYNYIKYTLQSPDAAMNIVKKIEESIMDLNFMPERFELLDLEGSDYKNIRKLIVKNYIVVYKVLKKDCRVDVLRVFYSKRNISSI